MQNFVFHLSPAFASKTDDIWYNIHHQYLLIAFYVFKKYAYAVENVTRVGMKLLKPQAILYCVCEMQSICNLSYPEGTGINRYFRQLQILQRCSPISRQCRIELWRNAIRIDKRFCAMSRFARNWLIVGIVCPMKYLTC